MKTKAYVYRAAGRIFSFLYTYLWKAYLLNVLVWFDQGVNTLLAPIFNGLLLVEAYVAQKPISLFARFGFPDERLSSVFGKNQAHSLWCRFLVKALDYREGNHTSDAAENNEGGPLGGGGENG